MKMSWMSINLSVLAIAALLYGFWHEQEVIEFEQKLFKAIKRRIKNGK